MKSRRLIAARPSPPEAASYRLKLGLRMPLAAAARVPSGHTAEQRDERAASHYRMPPVLPTERIAHLGTADCCIHPPGRNEIAITPPKIFSKEVAQSRPPHFLARTSSPPEIVSDQVSGDGA
jgi:hypothetical protein